MTELGEGLDHLLGSGGLMAPGTKTHLLTLAFLVTCGCGFVGCYPAALWEILGSVQLESDYFSCAPEQAQPHVCWVPLGSFCLPDVWWEGP